MAKRGRPKFNINYDEVEKLASIMCTVEEIASFLGCHRDTLYADENFSDIYKKGLDKGKMSLRRNQYKLSQSNPTMAIWLGKQYLNQKDLQINETTIVNNPINELIKSIENTKNENK